MKIFIKKDKFILAAAMALGAVNSVASAFVAVILQRILDIAIQGNIEGFKRVLVIMIIYITVLSLIAFVEAMCGKLLLRNVTRNMRDRVFSGVMRRRPDVYYKSNSVDYLSAVVNDVKLIEENYLIPLLECCYMVVMFIATLGILCWLSPLVTVILIGFLLLMFLVPALLGKALQNRQDIYSQKLASFTSTAKDYFSGFEVIRGFTVGGYIMRKFRKANQETAEAKFHADRLIAVNESVAAILSVISTVVVVFVAAWLVLKGSITAGTLLALIQLSSTFSVPVLVIMQYFPKIQSMKPILEKLGGICNNEKDWENGEVADTMRNGEVADIMEPVAESTIENRMPAEFSTSIKLKKVAFEYESENPVLCGINLSIENGKKYALLGESGCGKSTLIKLLTGYFRDYQGSVTYDGKDLRDMTRRDFSNIVSVIHQNVYMFDGDVYENICLGESFTDAELDEALERSGVNRFMDDLENGIHTQMGENGSKLSGGQRQRIALARALIRKTPLLVLDEGTSAVDQKTALEIERDLLKEKDLTLVAITHHMHGEVEGLYDEILYMRDGKLV